MREILFRGKRADNGEWVEGTGVFFDGVNTWLFRNRPNTAIAFGVQHEIVDPNTVGQYTGMTDNNGKKIFEGDIVTIPAYGGGRWKAAVYFKDGKFAVDGSRYHFKDIATRHVEVIGNIHDNPELIGGNGNG